MRHWQLFIAPIAGVIFIISCVLTGYMSWPVAIIGIGTFVVLGLLAWYVE